MSLDPLQVINECELYNCSPTDLTNSLLFTGVCSEAPAPDNRTCTCPTNSETVTTVLWRSNGFLGCKCASGYEKAGATVPYTCTDIAECLKYGCPPQDLTNALRFNGTCINDLGGTLNSRVCTCPANALPASTTISGSSSFQGCECASGYRVTAAKTGCEVLLPSSFHASQPHLL